MSDSGFLRTEPLIRATPETVTTAPATPRVDALPPAAPATNVDQLARIEDKTARIEDKFARSETLMLRMQATFEEVIGEFSGLARRNDLAAIEKRVRFLPGFGALVVTAIIAAVLASALTLAALKFGLVTIETK